MATSLNHRLREGITAAKAGAFDKARPLLEEVTRQSPDELLAWLWLAAASPSADSAIACLRKVLTLDRAHETARQGLAKLLVTQSAAAAAAGDRAAAKSLADEATELAPQTPSTWLALAAVVDGDERLDALRRAVSLHSQDQQLRKRLRQALLYRANTTARVDRAHARALFLEALEFDRRDTRVWLALAHLADAPADAVETLRQLLNIEPEHGAGRSLLKGALVADARALRSRGAIADAVARLRESIVIDAGNINAWLELAETTEDGDESAQALDRAAAIEPDHPRVLAAVARLREQLDAPDAVSAAAFDHFAGASADPSGVDDDEGFAQFDLHVDSPVESVEPVARVEAVEPKGTPAPEPPPSEPIELASAPVPPTPGIVEPAPAPVPLPVPPPAPQRRTVMVVDDSPTIRKILSLTLERAGYDVVAAADGEAALARFDTVIPDLVFLDIAMPNLDGYEVCKRIKKSPRTAHIPVVMLSGKDAFFDRVKGKVAGATEYLTKPFETPVVLSVVATHCPIEEVVHG
jgi:twitching motility two-component system response regulator PilG